MRTEKLLDRTEIQVVVNQLGERINADYEGKNLLLLCVLKGGIVFLADLMRAVSIPLDIGFIQAFSYGDKMETSGDVRLNFITPAAIHLNDFDIVVVEDICDTGLTFGKIKQELEGKCKSLRFASLLVKERDRDYHIDYIGFQIPDVFVVGYGLDAKNQFRNLPDIERVIEL